KFESLSKVSFMTSRMKSLKYLDISSNLLSHDGADVQCQWAESLTELDLSSNQLMDAVFECLPVNIKKLNLQNNHITSVPKGMAELKSLKELNLAMNRLADLPGCSGFTSLEFLNVEMNLILTPSADFFQSCPQVRELQAGRNPFKCSCELQDFIRLERHFAADAGAGGCRGLSVHLLGCAVVRADDVAVDADKAEGLAQPPRGAGDRSAVSCVHFLQRARFAVGEERADPEPGEGGGLCTTVPAREELYPRQEHCGEHH
uniref:Toll-like receptor 1LB n=1 Tax=Accipiter nisus TaxID=211598 RepID=A0A8B9N3L1_9AVES